MILSNPTGSYIAVLPKNEEDSASVVFTISNTSPPRSTLNIGQIPVGVENRQRSARDISDQVRRANLGDLVYVDKVNEAGGTVVGNQLFYIGQILEFNTDIVSTIQVINSAISTQHDVIRVGVDNIGLKESDLDVIESNAIAAQKQILIELEGLQKYQGDLEVDIVSQQKIINEANRVILGLNVILDKSPDNDAIQEYKRQIEESRAAARTAISEAVVELNALPTLIRVKHDELRSLATLIT